MRRAGDPLCSEEAIMAGEKDRVEGKLHEAKGTVREKAGEWTGDKEMEGRGEFEKHRGKAQGTVGKAKDKAAEAWDKAKGAMKEAGDTGDRKTK